MIQFLFCLFLLLPLIALSIGAFFISIVTGMVATVIAFILATPLLLGAYAHLDLLCVKSRYGLSEAELKVFIRLVPHLAGRAESAHLSSGETKRLAKQEAVQIVLDRRSAKRSTSDAV